MKLITFMFWSAVFFVPLNLPGHIKVATGRATIYFPGDNHSGNERADGKPFKKSDKHIAHRQLPLGTVGILCNKRTKQCIKTVVRDRGPFGAIISCKHAFPIPYRVAGQVFYAKKIRWLRKCYWWQAQPYQLKQGFKYRGVFDLTKFVAKQIDLKSFDVVTFVYGTTNAWVQKLHKTKLTTKLVSAILFESNKTESKQKWVSLLNTKNSIN